MCVECGHELCELLIGDGRSVGTNARSQPGIVWYVKQLYKTAYRQTKLGGDVTAKTSSTGYGLLADRRATTLLAEIGVVLAEWDDRLYAHKSRQKDERVMVSLADAYGYPEALCIRQARMLAAHVRLLRRHDKDVHQLHNHLHRLAREAWAVINRAPELCCGGCPNVIKNNSGEEDKRCGAIMYAEENARTVQCPRCRTKHDVEVLREEMRVAALDYVLPSTELMTLMETRLNDRIPPSSFYQLVRDGRLQAHTETVEGVGLYRYQDVVAARNKPPPVRKTHAR